MTPQRLKENTVSAPVVTVSAADAELDPAPIPSDWIIEGTPQTRSTRLAVSTDRTSSTIVWSCTAGRFNWHYTVDETLYVMSGEVLVTNEKGEVRRLGPGDMAHFPAGSHSIWYVPDYVKKIAFCRHSLPLHFGFALRVWNKLSRILTGSSAVGSQLERTPAVTDERARATAA
jgi:uncharacterized protein